MPGSQTTRGGANPRAGGPAPIAFCCHDGIGTPDYIAFAAHNLACTYPCQRFAGHLAALTHDSGPVWDATPFTVMDSHPQPPAGLPAHRGPLAAEGSPGGSYGLQTRLSIAPAREDVRPLPDARRRRRRSEGQPERAEAWPLHGRGYRDAAHGRGIDEAGPRACRKGLVIGRIQGNFSLTQAHGRMSPPSQRRRRSCRARSPSLHRSDRRDRPCKSRRPERAAAKNRVQQRRYAFPRCGWQCPRLCR